MPRCSAGNDQDTVCLNEFVNVFTQSTEGKATGLRIKSSAKAIANRFRLFKNFFQHEMFKAAFFDGFKFHVNRLNVRCKRKVRCICYAEFSVANHGDLLVVEVYHLIRIFNYRCCIRSQEELIFSDTYYERAAFSRSNKQIRIRCRKYHDRVSADNLC